MFSQTVWLLLSFLLFLAWRFLKFSIQVRKICGIYSQPGVFYWPKFYLIRWLIARQQKKRAESAETFSGDIFHMSREDKLKKYNVDLMDKKQKVPEGILKALISSKLLHYCRITICWRLYFL
jgi:hypothetical protein